MSQTEIICACVIGVIGLLGLISLGVLVSVLEYKAKSEKTKQLERIANACFGIEQGLEEIRLELLPLSTISADIDRIEVHQYSFFQSAFELGNKIIQEIEKVGE